MQKLSIALKWILMYSIKCFANISSFLTSVSLRNVVSVSDTSPCSMNCARGGVFERLGLKFAILPEGKSDLLVPMVVPCVWG